MLGLVLIPRCLLTVKQAVARVGPSLDMELIKVELYFLYNLTVVDKHGIEADLCFGHGPILLQMNLQNSQTQPYDECTRVISLALFMWSITQISS